MKKILRSVLSIGALAIIAIIATNAFFSDTAESVGNVFQAGGVSISLAGLGHAYLAADNQDPQGNCASEYCDFVNDNTAIEFHDLKPLDWGEISGQLTNHENPAYVCARVMDPNTSGQSPFEDMLNFRIAGIGGGSFAEVVSFFGLNQWFSLDPSDDALAMDEEESVNAQVEYCFGVYDNGNCILDPNVSDYNPAQGQQLTLDLEFYAVQQRNNPDFSCADMNPLQAQVTEATGWASVANHWIAKARNGGANTYEMEVGRGPGDRSEDDLNWVDNQSLPFTLSFDAVTGYAFLDVDGTISTYDNLVTSFTPLSGSSNGQIAVHGKASTGNTIDIELVSLNLASSGPVVLTGDTSLFNDGSVSEMMHLGMSGLDLSQGFTLTGTIGVDRGGSTTDERPAMEIHVSP